MLRNPRVIKDAYECGKLMADWLVFKKQLPLLGIDKNVYFFTNDGKLLEALKDAPWWLQFINLAKLS